jgi:hypothetical protein
MASNDLNKLIKLYLNMAEKATDPNVKLRAGQLTLAFMQLKRPRKKRSDAGKTDEVQDTVSQIERLLG